jgi:hypothetical protein
LHWLIDGRLWIATATRSAVGKNRPLTPRSRVFPNNSKPTSRSGPPRWNVAEDADWIDEVSESTLTEFLMVIPQSPSLVLVTYRPEYRGALRQAAGAQTIVLASLSDSETTVLVPELLGSKPSVEALGHTIVERAAGNPFFAKEIVRDLAERGVLDGQPGAYKSTVEGAEVNVPATLQATIAARIDRLDPKAKRTLSAAAVVGSRFGIDLLTASRACPGRRTWCWARGSTTPAKPCNDGLKNKNQRGRCGGG